MEKFKPYDVAFASLSLGRHDFEFQITQEFFDLFEFDQDFQNPNLHILMTMDKNSTFMDLNFELSGEVELECDITGESFMESLENTADLTVKFGEDYDISDDEVWIIPYGEHKINIAQLMYELVLLAIPMKRIHPDVENGKSNSEMLDLLEKYALGNPNSSSEDSDNDETDPRWEALKKLKK